jgi:hypothetical protein
VQWVKKGNDRVSAVEAKMGVQSDVQSMESFQPDLMEGKRCFVGKRKGVQSDVQSMESFQPDLMEGKRCFVKFS